MEEAIEIPVVVGLSTFFCPNSEAKVLLLSHL
jgi:hypothetical protein